MKALVEILLKQVPSKIRPADLGAFLVNLLAAIANGTVKLDNQLLANISQLNISPGENRYPGGKKCLTHVEYNNSYILNPRAPAVLTNTQKLGNRDLNVIAKEFSTFFTGRDFQLDRQKIEGASVKSMFESNMAGGLQLSDASIDGRTMYRSYTANAETLFVYGPSAATVHLGMRLYKTTVLSEETSDTAITTKVTGISQSDAEWKQIKDLLNFDRGWMEYVGMHSSATGEDAVYRKLSSTTVDDLMSLRMGQSIFGNTYDITETANGGGASGHVGMAVSKWNGDMGRGATGGGARATRSRRPLDGDSPLVPLLALQTARVGYYAHLMRTPGGVDLCGMSRDAVYGIAFFWALHVAGLMSESSVQTGLVAVLISWCLTVTYWSAAKTVRTMGERPTINNMSGRVGLAATTAIMIGVPVVMVRDHHEGVHGGKRKKPAKPSSGKKPARPSSGKTRPLSGYNKFVRKCSGTPEAKTRSGTHMMKYCAAQWNKLSKEEKLSYK
eukprot:jgi/Tetstr1/454024/TSEL_040943.t1